MEKYENNIKVVLENPKAIEYYENLRNLPDGIFKSKFKTDWNRLTAQIRGEKNI